MISAIQSYISKEDHAIYHRVVLVYGRGSSRYAYFLGCQQIEYAIFGRYFCLFRAFFIGIVFARATHQVEAKSEVLRCCWTAISIRREIDLIIDVYTQSNP